MERVSFPFVKNEWKINTQDVAMVSRAEKMGGKEHDFFKNAVQVLVYLLYFSFNETPFGKSVVEACKETFLIHRLHFFLLHISGVKNPHDSRRISALSQSDTLNLLLNFFLSRSSCEESFCEKLTSTLERKA